MSRRKEERPDSSLSQYSNSNTATSSKAQLKMDDEPLMKVKKKNICTKILDVLWATRQTRMDAKENSELLIKTTLKELIIYIVYLIVISIITFGMANSINFYYTNILMNLFLNQQSSSQMSFSSMGVMSDFWDVHTGPLLDGLYWEKWYNGQNSTEQGFIYFENKLLGVPRLRQLRVKNGSCSVHPYFKNLITDCYAAYSSSAEDTAPFGKYTANTPTSMLNDTAFYYQEPNIVGAPSISGTISSYGTGGYIKNLGLTRAESDAIMQDLKDNTWTDRSTRVVFLDFTVYNGNINIFSQVRLMTEFPPTGGVVPSSTFRTVKLIRYVTPMDYFVLACEVIFTVFTIYYTIEESLEIRIHKLSYFKGVWNVLDIVILIISYLCIGFNIYRILAVNKMLDSLLANSTQYPEFDSLTFWQTQFNAAVAITAFLCWIKFFKYVSFNKTMTQLSSTLGRCAKDIFGFSIMFFIIFFAYAQLGFLLFGDCVPDYSSFLTTIFTLYRIILGDFDFPTLESNSRVLGPIYFMTFVFFVFFVLLNMFLAIINDTYSDVKSDIASSKSEFELGEYFKRGYDKILTKMHLKKDKIVDIQQALEVADENTDKTVNFDEWRKELRKRGYADTEIESYFAKYDQDGNRNLTEEEQKHMRDDLKNQFKKIDNEIQNFNNGGKEGEEKTNDELPEEGLEPEVNKENLVSHSEFKILNERVDTMESSIGNIVNRIDSVLSKLEYIEKAKLKRREAMAKILEKIEDPRNLNDEIKRLQLQNMIKDELEKWDEPFLSSRSSSAGYISRAASPLSGTPDQLKLGEKKAWRQQ